MCSSSQKIYKSYVEFRFDGKHWFSLRLAGKASTVLLSNRPVILSITHNLPSREEPGMEIVQFSEAAPDNDVTRRRVVFPCKIAAELRRGAESIAGVLD